MKAIVHDRYGPPEDVLEMREVDDPAARDDEVVVRVAAAAVNWADWAITRGEPYILRVPYGVRRPRKRIRGTDVAGRVEAVGTAVTALRPGDEVFGWCGGAFAEFVRGAADHFVRTPPTLTPVHAAAVPMAGCVALQAFRDVSKVIPGQRVLVNGASGGIGSFAVQIAKAFDAEVTGVCSTGNVDLVRSIGADHVIDYTVEDFTQAGTRYDLILDIADTHTLTQRRRVLTERGTLIPNSGVGGPWIGSLGRVIKARVVSPFVSQTLRPFVAVERRRDLVFLCELIEAGQVKPVVDRTYPLAETAAAIGYVGKGHARGKVVVTV